ncbi:MAG: M20 family metallopeptidase [Candidatus Planktophila sp.]|nr:M20 family metallopeptidase [Candidatus Planktophila sp.]
MTYQSSIHEGAQVLQPDLIELRHRLHQRPEIGLHLPETQAMVLSALDGLGLEISLGKTSSSVTAVLRGAKRGKAVLLRGDMDALPIHEESGVVFSSTIDGAMHACGHDLHTAMLVGAAKLLSAHRDQLQGDVVFMFQPGEEGHDGAAHMIAEGVLDAAGVRASSAYGIHVTSGSVPRNVFTTKSGTMMASADELHVTVRGAGGHGSMPHFAKDPIVVAAQMVGDLQTLVTRNFDIFDPIVVTVGYFHAGTKANIIPSEAKFEVTIRAFSLIAREKILREAKLLCEKIGEAYGLEVDAVAMGQYPVTINHSEHAQFVADTTIELFGKDSYAPMEFPIAGAEDFSRVLLEVPGSYMFLGACTSDDYATAPSNHSALATFDDSVLCKGVEMHAELAIRALAREK